MSKSKKNNKKNRNKRVIETVDLVEGVEVTLRYEIEEDVKCSNGTTYERVETWYINGVLDQVSRYGVKTKYGNTMGIQTLNYKNGKLDNIHLWKVNLNGSHYQMRSEVYENDELVRISNFQCKLSDGTTYDRQVQHVECGEIVRVEIYKYFPEMEDGKFLLIEEFAA